MKGFLAIRLSKNEYFSILSLNDTAVKRVVLGKLPDETNVKLDFYISEYEDFSNPIIIGSFFLDNLSKESASINVYFKIDSMMLYVYGECDGITSKSKFDLSLMSLSVASDKISDSLEDASSNNLSVGFSGLEHKEDFVKEFGGGVGHNSFSDVGLDNVNSSFENQNLFANEKSSNNEDDLSLLTESLNSDNNVSVNENLNSESDLNLENFDFGLQEDRFNNNLDEGNQSEHVLSDKDIISQESLDLDDISVDIGYASEAYDNFDSINVNTSKSSYLDDWSIDDIITDIDEGLGESEFDDVALDLSEEGFTVDIDNSQLDLDSGEGLIQTSMLYLSLISLFLLIFFSLFLIFSKVLNPKNFAVSYCLLYEEERIIKCKKNSYV
ncbi:hypothetical protein [Borrelia coriaceae]|uniref:hypothetical protein n=1 Tax=Borrelia coriaceae TaxID=144 RepID=UPI00046CF0BA|nr:hypothetical protein [Borrelia coriaceae]